MIAHKKSLELSSEFSRKCHLYSRAKAHDRKIDQKKWLNTSLAWKMEFALDGWDPKRFEPFSNVKVSKYEYMV